MGNFPYHIIHVIIVKILLYRNNILCSPVFPVHAPYKSTSGFYFFIAVVLIFLFNTNLTMLLQMLVHLYVLTMLL